MKIRISACSLFVAATSAMLCLAQAESAPLAPPTNVNGNAGQNTPAIAEIEINEPAAPNLQRQVVNYATPAAVGTIIIDTAETYLYFVLGSGKAIRKFISANSSMRWNEMCERSRRSDFIPAA